MNYNKKIDNLIDANDQLKTIVYRQENDAMNVEKITKKQIFDEQYKQFVNVNGQFLQRFIANEIVNKLNIICDYSESTSHFKLSLQYDNKNILTEPIYIPRK